MPGQAPRVPLNRIATTPQARPNTVQCQLRGGRQNTASTISSSTTSANTIAFTQAEARSRPDTTWTKATTTAQARPTMAPRHKAANGGCSAQAQAIAQG